MGKSSAHQEAVQRRLALLGDELAGLRPPQPSGPTGTRVPTDPAGQPGAPGQRDGSAWSMPETHTRIRERVAPVEEVPPTPVPRPTIPEPGRHAHRTRPQARQLPRLPSPASVHPASVHLAPVHLAVVLALVAAGLGCLCWWLVRSSPHEVAPLPPSDVSSASPIMESTSGSEPPASPASGNPADASDVGGEVTVDVEGKVRRPGIVVLDGGSRVVDALKAAGGVRPGQSTRGLNLARVLVDGEQILVGVPMAVPVTSTGGGLPPAAPRMVNLNTAAQTDLESLPEVGPVTAQAILAWRSEHGAFTSVQELLEVDGIGEATLDKLLAYVTV